MKHSYLKHILLCLCLFAGAKTFAYVEIDGIYYNIPIYGNNVSVTSCNRQYSGSVVIPSSVTYNSETYNVTSIGDYAFRDCSGLTSVTIPNSVTSIGGYAFQNCTGLTSITIPGSVTDTGYEAFNKCTGLTSVTIQNGVTRIGKGSFSDCKGLTSISIPNSVTSIGSFAFSGCTGLTSVTIPGSVTSIGENNVTGAFSGCTSLTSVTIQNGVTNIYYGTFYGCTSLTSVSIPPSVTYIGQEAFALCTTSLVSFYIRDMAAWSSITFDKNWCYDLHQGHISYNIVLNNEEVTHLLIPQDAKKVNTQAFINCRGISAISVEEGNTVYDSRQNCNAIIETESNTLLVGCKSSFIPEGVSAIHDSAFFKRDELTSMTFPKSMQSIGINAFHGCKLRNILVKCPIPPVATASSFSAQTYYHTTLYIPAGSWDAYAYDDAWYKFINIRETATAGAQLSMQQAYTLMDAGTFAYSVYDPVNDRISNISSTGIDENNPNHSWQVIEVGGKRYLYNLGAKKFASSFGNDLKLTSEATAIEMDDGKDGIVFGEQAGRQWTFVSNDHMNVEDAIADAIISPTHALSKGEGKWYSLDGKQFCTPQKGVDIIHHSDGTRGKVLIK